MTYISKKQRWYLRFPIIGIAGTLIMGAIFSVSFYNKIVDLRYELRSQEFAIGEQAVRNAELKNSLYEVLDVERFESVALELGLVIERNPEYLETEVITVATTL